MKPEREARAVRFRRALDLGMILLQSAVCIIGAYFISDSAHPTSNLYAIFIIAVWLSSSVHSLSYAIDTKSRLSFILLAFAALSFPSALVIFRAFEKL